MCICLSTMYYTCVLPVSVLVCVLYRNPIENYMCICLSTMYYTCVLPVSVLVRVLYRNPIENRRLCIICVFA
jgi:hypothetical protein